MPFGLTVGPDNNLWFTESGIGSVGRMTTSGDVSDYRVPVRPGHHEPVQPCSPSSPTSPPAPDGSLWASSVDGRSSARSIRQPAR